MMGQRTDRFDFNTIGPGDSLADDGFKFPDLDIRYMDILHRIGVELHRHTGEPLVDATPLSGPSATVLTSGGSLAAGLRIQYKYTLVDEFGLETGGSPATTVETPTPVSEPGAPSLTYVNSGGVLEPGYYTYVLSAYTSASTLETKATNVATIQVNETTAASVVTLDMPSLPAGATGFNIYRKGPGSPRLYYLASTAASTYDDDGSVDVLTSRTVPSENSTNSTNAVTIAIPGATPTVPLGYTWRLYRTITATDWSNSLLKNVVEETSEGSGVITPVFDDVGQKTTVGRPPDRTQAVASPPKISLTDAAEVQGTLPPGLLVPPEVFSFTFDGLVQAVTGLFLYTCEFAQMDVIGIRPFLGFNRSPASQPVIVTAYHWDESASTWTEMFTSGVRPRVLVGSSIGARVAPDVAHHAHLEVGDQIRIDILQAGGGATPTDYDLGVNIFFYANYGSTTTSYTWSS